MVIYSDLHNRKARQRRLSPRHRQGQWGRRGESRLPGRAQPLGLRAVLDISQPCVCFLSAAFWMMFHILSLISLSCDQLLSSGETRVTEIKYSSAAAVSWPPQIAVAVSVD